MKVLFLSNGAGEDAIGARVVRGLTRLRADAFPLVGRGEAYAGAAELVGPVRRLPSGGLVRESWRNLGRDLAAGLTRHLARQFCFLRGARSEYAAAVAVGDLVPVLAAGLAGLRPLLFVGTAKSIWHHGYSLPERLLIRWLVERTLTRDEPTAQALRRHGLATECVGNAMMDELEPLGLDLRVAPHEVCLAVFPGSRQGAYRDMPRLLEAYRLMVAQGTHARALVGLADTVDPVRLAQACPGWSLRPGPAQTQGVVGRLERAQMPDVLLVRRALGDLLSRAQVALGQAGTANEQAAGMGVPVVAFAPGGESRLGWYRGRQKGLLGEAVKVVEDEPRALCAELVRLLADPAERERRGAVGRQRMGPPGASLRMARIIEAAVPG